MPPKRKAMPTTGVKATRTMAKSVYVARNFPITIRAGSIPVRISDS